MKSAYRVLAYLIAITVFVQAGAIAFAMFTTDKLVDGGGALTTNTDPNVGEILHGVVGTMVIPLLVLILLIVSFFAQVPGGVRLAVVLFVLVVVQIALAFLAFDAPAVGALHGMNALAILGTAITAGGRSRSAAQPAPA